ncbi:hypothetical protein [Tateyamaria sp.]|uniref:hypothetical protein n=1 Tax=Tateyamaria sp. TaxID=1929288 RepID=UPI00329BDDB1
MPKKDFVMIGTDILEWGQFKNLKSCRERNAYLTAILSSPANYIGTFRYRLALFACEANIPESDLMPVIELLEAADLIEYDKKEEYVRLVDWFYTSNITVSQKTVKGAAKDYLKRGVPKIELVSRSIAEFVVGSLVGVKAYKETSEHGPLVIAELKDFLVEATLSFPNLERCLFNEMSRSGAVVKAAYGDVFTGVVQGETLNESQIATTAETRPRDGSETPSKHKTKPYLNNIHINTEPALKQSDRAKDSGTTVLAGPTQSTLDSDLVRGSKRMKAF